MNLKKFQCVIFAFLILVSVSYAQDYSLYPGKFYEDSKLEEKIEFDFYNGTYDMCENEQKLIPILIVNNGDAEERYSVNSFGAGWIKLNANEFSLQGKQDGAVFLELSPLENTRGIHSIGVNAASSGNYRKSLAFDVNVERCRSLRLELQEDDKVCGGITKEYGAELTNEGNQGISAELNLNAPNWVNLGGNSFTIAPNDTEKLELTADIPPNAKGVFNVILNAAVKDFPSIKSVKKLAIEVVPKHDCYKAEIIADAKIENDYSNVYIPIRVRNNGIRQANYEISMEAPNWVSIEPKELNVKPGQFGSLNLNINPGDGIAEGSYPVKIHVKFEDIAYSKSITIGLSKNKLLKELKSLFDFYQYYIYVILAVAVLLLIFRRRISTKIKDSYKKYRTRKSRLKALEAARKARQLKKEIRNLGRAGHMAEETKKYGHNKFFLFLLGLAILISALSFAVYKFSFPVSKEFIKSYYPYIIAGFLISIFVIFVVEFYKPIFNLLKKLK